MPTFSYDITTLCGTYTFAIYKNSIWIVNNTTNESKIFVGRPYKAGYKNGKGKFALFSSPTHLLFTPDNKHILVADHWNYCIRLIELSSSIVTTYAGRNTPGLVDGDKKIALFKCVSYLTFSPDNKVLFVCDNINNVIRRIHILTGYVDIQFILPMFNSRINKLSFSQHGQSMIIDTNYGIHEFNIETGLLITTQSKLVNIHQSKLFINNLQAYLKKFIPSFAVEQLIKTF
jgi:hypothetical protein